jgi:hypothetical protein
MNVHEAVDGLEGWIRSRKNLAPIESAVTDLDRFVGDSPRDAHPAVEPADLDFDPPERTGSLLGRLPPSRVARIERSFEFSSPVETAHPENDTVEGVRWHGDGREESSTAVVMLHGAFAPSFAGERLVSAPLLRRDVHSFALAEPYHMGRAPTDSEYSGQYLLSGDVPRYIGGIVQSVAEVRALVAALREEGYDSVYLSGISLGGNIAAQALTMAEVDGGFLFVPAVDLFETLQRAPLARGVKRAALRAGFAQTDVRDAMRTITPRLLGSPVPDLADVHVVYGQYDRQAPPEPIEALVESWSGASSTRFPAGHRTMALRFLSLRHQFAGWLDAKLADASAE